MSDEEQLYYSDTDGFTDEEEYEETFSDGADSVIHDAVEKLQAYIKGKALEELRKIKEENNRLNARIDMLIKQNTELKSREAGVRLKEENLERDFVKRKWRELEDELSTTVYTTDCNCVTRPKCNCCDDRRKIHFKSADGEEYIVDCKCNKSYTVYSVQKAHLFQMYLHKNKYDELRAEAYYFRESGASKDDYVCIVDTTDGPITEVPESWEGLPWRPAFATYELCQEYCDWCNRNVPKEVLEVSKPRTGKFERIRREKKVNCGVDNK